MFGDLKFVKLISLVYEFNSCYEFNFKFILASLYYFSFVIINSLRIIFSWNQPIFTFVLKSFT